MGKKYFVIIVLILLSTSFSCDLLTGPGGDVQPGRRDYVWTVDTLEIPQGEFFYPSRIWGSSPDDVWLVGGIASSSPYMIWHFDGTAWKHDSVARPIAPSALWGSARNDIWLGNRGSFWRFGGTQWSKFSDITPPMGYELVDIENIWGPNAFDVWGVGFADQINGTAYKGVIMHLSGGRWDYMPIPDLRISLTEICEQYSSGLLFVEGRRVADAISPDTFKVYLYDGERSLKEIYSGPYEMQMEQIGTEVYFTGLQKVYKYTNDSLTLWKDFSGTDFWYGMVGRSGIDFFDESRNGGILHYNGTDLVELYKPPSPPFARCVFDFDVFFVCQDITTGVVTILHGRLPK